MVSSLIGVTRGGERARLDRAVAAGYARSSCRPACRRSFGSARLPFTRSSPLRMMRWIRRENDSPGKARLAESDQPAFRICPRSPQRFAICTRAVGVCRLFRRPHFRHAAHRRQPPEQCIETGASSGHRLIPNEPVKATSNSASARREGADKRSVAPLARRRTTRRSLEAVEHGAGKSSGCREARSARPAAARATIEGSW